MALPSVARYIQNAIQRGTGVGRVPGGRVTTNISSSDSVTAAASNNAFVDFAQTYSIPANTLTTGTVVKIRALVRVSNDSGTDTLTCKLVLGSTDLIATTAVDPSSTTVDIHILEFEVTCREVASADSSCVGSGRWVTNDNGTIAHGTGILLATDFATNGALTIKAAAKWSSNTASTACVLDTLDVTIV
jgi:hypothetical protein